MKKIEKYQFLYHFLPHEEKKRRAKMLSSGYLIFYVIVVLFLSVTFRVLPKYFPGVLGYASDISVSELLDYTNQKFNDGLNLDILSVEKDPSLPAPIVKETIEPTILVKGQVVRKAKIILLTNQ